MRQYSLYGELKECPKNRQTLLFSATMYGPAKQIAKKHMKNPITVHATKMVDPTKLKPAFATLPMPGVQPALVDAAGNEIEGNEVEGRLCVKFPWPSIARTVYGDHKRYRETYFSAFPGMYFTS